MLTITSNILISKKGYWSRLKKKHTVMRNSTDLSFRKVKYCCVLDLQVKAPDLTQGECHFNWAQAVSLLPCCQLLILGNVKLIARIIIASIQSFSLFIGVLLWREMGKFTETVFGSKEIFIDEIFDEFKSKPTRY